MIIEINSYLVRNKVGPGIFMGGVGGRRVEKEIGNSTRYQKNMAMFIWPPCAIYLSKNGIFYNLHFP